MISVEREGFEPAVRVVLLPPSRILRVPTDKLSTLCLSVRQQTPFSETISISGCPCLLFACQSDLRLVGHEQSACQGDSPTMLDCSF
jgi:hypothetical protein